MVLLSILNGEGNFQPICFSVEAEKIDPQTVETTRQSSQIKRVLEEKGRCFGKWRRRLNFKIRRIQCKCLMIIDVKGCFDGFIVLKCNPTVHGDAILPAQSVCLG